jgi:type 1 glutamine amidotransferase
VNPHPSAYQSDLRKTADVLVLYDLAETTGERARQNLRSFVESGKGVVAIHHALANNQEWPWWYEEVLGGVYFMKPKGPHPGSTFREGLHLRIRKSAEHPVTAGISDFEIVDEVYNRLWLSPKVHVLLTTNHPESQGPVAWISPYEKSRVVYIQLGHGREAHENPVFRKLIRNAILWAAGKVN